jgi:esterase/lipase
MFPHSFTPTDLPDDPVALDEWLQRQEDRIPNLKSSARASIVWADTARKKKTEFALVYLHGFKACHPEGHPIHREVARYFGWNLYLSRLEGHGLDVKKPLAGLKPASLLRSALKSIAVGEKLGKKVILMGTSTGGSLSLYLAGNPKRNSSIKALLLYSPLIEFYSFNQWLLGNNLGRSLLSVLPGRGYMLKSEPGMTDREDEIWYPRYALQGALSLGKFVQETMKAELFARVKVPTFIGYYYKNRKEQDRVVSVDAIKNMYAQLGTSHSQKLLRNYPEAGTHVISSGLLSRNIEELKNDSIRFLNRHIDSEHPQAQ